MGDLVVGGMDVVGDGTDGDVEGAMMLGAGRRRHATRVPTPRWMNATTSQGVSRPQEELDVLPLGAVTAPSAEGSQANVLATLTSNPQRPFRGERFVFTAVNSDGVDVAFSVNIVMPIFVGMINVGASFGQMPLASFSPAAFGVRMSVPAAGQGTIIVVNFVILAIPAGKSVTVSGSLFGRAMR